MTRLIELVIGALVALDLTASFVAVASSSIHLTLQARYEGNDRSVVSLDCNVAGFRSDRISVKFFKRVPGGGSALYLLTNKYRDPAAEQVVILDQTDRSIRFRFSQTQEGYFRCRSGQGHYSSNEVGLAGSINLDNNMPLLSRASKWTVVGSSPTRPEAAFFFEK